MKVQSRFLGGILLVAGTSIGAGMLALPVTTAFGGFIPSLCVFLLIWALMLSTANFFLDVNLEIRGEPNFISMAEKTLGKVGKMASWVFYLLLLYSLLAAYISSCSPLFDRAFTEVFRGNLPTWLTPFFLPLLFSGFVCLGTQGIDYLNRILMVGLIVSYFLLTGTSVTHIETSRLLHVDFSASLLAIPVVITSFGYHIIIPTLTTYMEHKEKSLRKIILIGSLIPLFVYILWQLVVLGSVPFSDLLGAWSKGLPATDPLSEVVQSGLMSSCSRFFSFFAIITSFLGVSLALSDFLTDGLKIKKSWEGRLMAIGLTFVPPLVFVFFCQKSFYVALEYAGIFVAILLGVIPSLMVLKLKKTPRYKNIWKRIFVFIVIALFILMIALNLFEKQGGLQRWILPYLQ